MNRSVIPAIALVCVTSCAGKIQVPDLGSLYSRSAQYHETGRNPVIVIPGILGSRLADQKTGKTVWGVFGGDFVNPKTEDGARTIALPMQRGAELAKLVDDTTSVGALDRVRLRLFGVPLQVRAYAQVLGILGVGGYRDEELGEAGAVDYGDDHFTCFQFHYDWRRDNAENAARLYAFMLEKREYVKNEMKKRFGSAPEELRFDIVAHSMGGLITRYMLRHGDVTLPPDGPPPPVTWKGAALVDRVVLVGTPNAGSVEALTQLLQGYKLGPLLPWYDGTLLGTFPSIYQLLPRPRHRPVVVKGSAESVDILDPEVWIARGWGLASPRAAALLETLLPEEGDAAQRREIALDHLTKCLARARQFFAALDRPVPPPDDLRLHLFAGDATPTAAVAEVLKDNRVRIAERAPGDGTVLRTSALFDERVGKEWSPYLETPLNWTQVVLLFTNHLDLTRDPAFADNLLYLLLESTHN